VNRPIRTLSVFCLVLFLALMINISWIQWWKASSYDDRGDNQRAKQAEFSRQRGAILAGKVTVAQSVPSHDQYQYQRVYPKGAEYAPVTGFFSYVYGTTGVEHSESDILSGDDDRLFVNRISDMLNNTKPAGGNVELTINPAVQDAGWKALQALGSGVQGAAVAIDPRTGKILAMVSTPSFDPALLASHNVRATQKAEKGLHPDDPSSPMLNRAIQTTLPPGSTFKLVTAAAAIEKGMKPSDLVDGAASLRIPGHSKAITNENGYSCGGLGKAQVTFQQALDYSCNVAFASLAMKHLSGNALRTQAEKFGWGKSYLTDIGPQAVSQFPSGKLDQAYLALSSFGQYDVTATPLQMAMVSAGIANGGTVMKPYVVDRLTSSKLNVLDQTKPQVLDQAVSRQTASTLTTMMEGVVNDPGATGAQAKITGIEVAGKTGTAQSSPDRPPYAWFTSFAPAENPSIAVAVLVQKSGTPRTDIAGGALCAPIARAMMEAEIQP
jgi:penicillin-binding protein A